MSKRRALRNLKRYRMASIGGYSNHVFDLWLATSLDATTWDFFPSNYMRFRRNQIKSRHTVRQEVRP